MRRFNQHLAELTQALQALPPCMCEAAIADLDSRITALHNNILDFHLTLDIVTTTLQQQLDRVIDNQLGRMEHRQRVVREFTPPNSPIAPFVPRTRNPRRRRRRRNNS